MVIEAQLFKHRCGRDSLVLALGGGVVGDLAGFVAATYMRGIPYLQLPTSLLAMVDSSVGGKTGIDTPYGKNLIGAFWQPQAVIADMNCLATLSSAHLINGLIEAIKMFLTHQSKSFYYVKKHLDRILTRDRASLTQVIYQAVSIKAAVVSQDEKESNLRMILNAGHTIGHALEHLSHYQLMHGLAVGYGLLVEAKMAEQLGYLSQDHYQEIAMLLARLGVEGRHLKKYSPERLIQATKLDKKIKSGQSYYVLLNEIGGVQCTRGRVAQVVDDRTVKKAIQAVSGG